MRKIEVITVSGKPGSGKSTTARGAAERLGYSHFSSGDLFREIAAEQEMDVAEANFAAEDDASIDEAVDQRLRDIAEDDRKHRVAIDSRMAWHWMPGSYKVYLDLGLETAARRIINDMDEERLLAEHIPPDPSKYAEHLERRLLSEARRYRNLYGVDPYDFDNYDLVVDTEQHNAESTIGLVVSEFRDWLQAI